MVGSGLKEALRSLCCRHGWSYGVIWRVADLGDPGLLTMGEAYCEEHISMVIDNMLHQVHRIGEGIIGEVTLSGKHQWIYSDTCCRKWSLEGSNDNPDMFQTTAIISLLPLGVVQFGSTQKIIESSDFIDQVTHLFGQLQSMSGSFLYRDAQIAINSEIHDPCRAFASVIRSGDSYSGFKNINATHNYSFKEMMVKEQYSAVPFQSSSPALGSLHGSMHANSLAVPIISSSGCSTKVFSDPSHKLTPFTANSFHLVNHCQTSSDDAQVMSSSNTEWSHGMMQANSCSDKNLVPRNPHRIVRNSGNSTLSLMEQGLLSGIGTEGFSSMFPTNSHTIVSHGSASHHFCGDFDVTSSHGISGSLDTQSNSGSLNIRKHRKHSAGELMDILDSSPLSTSIEGNTSSVISLSKGPYFAQELNAESVGFLTFPGDVTPEHATLSFSKSDPVSSLFLLNAKPAEQVNNDLTVPKEESLLGVVSVTSGLGESGDFVSIPVSELPSRPVENCITSTTSISVGELPIIPLENSVTGTTNSPGIGCDGKDNSSIAPAQTIPDIDLFDGMDLDLCKNSLGRGCWEEIIMSMGSGSCSNLITDVSECNPEFDVGAMTSAEKVIFSDYGLEQLLNSVSGGNVNSATSHNSVVTNGNHVIGENSEYKFPTTTVAESSPANGNQVQLVGLPCFNGSMDMLLPEYNLEKFMQGSQKEPLPKSRVSSSTDNSYCMNVESTVITKSKRPEEAVKVTKKRARPGESTRPRPKDRQLIQDRVKELRDIVPNGAKCSIDALLDRTIKHMLFLQSITKYAEKLKQADEPKMISEESGVVLKDNSSGGGGGATWAFEVAGQTMVCPIFVEELNPPGQMLVEMLCEEHGLFLEIADIIRGFGLTILKGVMEVRDRKIWARFLVEADRDVTRMDIFLSLVQLLQQTTKHTSSSAQPTKIIDSGVPTCTNYQQPPMPIPVSCSDGLQ